MAFFNRAFSLSKINKVQCPCNKCQNLRCFDKNMVALDLYQNGFVPYYEMWVHHGEKYAEEVVKSHSDDYDWWRQPIDEAIVYASGGRKAHGW
jgi:hypothetical protein